MASKFINRYTVVLLLLMISGAIYLVVDTYQEPAKSPVSNSETQEKSEYLIPVNTDGDPIDDIDQQQELDVDNEKEEDETDPGDSKPIIEDSTVQEGEDSDRNEINPDTIIGDVKGDNRDSSEISNKDILEGVDNTPGIVNRVPDEEDEGG